ncbi:unnamed protein product [Ectocarpus sp. 4 AP-2014]
MAASAAPIELEHVSGDTLGGSGITLVPKDGAYTNVVVWLHGLGDTAAGWASMMPQLKLPNTKFILPTADTRPITLNGGYEMPGWSDIFGLQEDSPEDAVGFNASADRVRAILEAEKAKGKESTRMVVGGFSQGGAVALHFCLRATEPLAGCVACSTWIPLNKDYPTALGSAAKDIPVAQFHGTRDEVVQFTWGQHSHILMKEKLGMTTTFEAIAGMGHSSSNAEMESVADFLKRVLPDGQ